MDLNDPQLVDRIMESVARALGVPAPEQTSAAPVSEPDTPAPTPPPPARRRTVQEPLPPTARNVRRRLNRWAASE